MADGLQPTADRWGQRSALNRHLGLQKYISPNVSAQRSDRLQYSPVTHLTPAASVAPIVNVSADTELPS
jgi:hypothetical protein